MENIERHKKLKCVFFLPMGGSVEEMKRSGVYSRLEKYYLPTYQKAYSKLFIVSYGQDVFTPKSASILTNKRSWHRYIWQLVIPFVYAKELHGALLRVMQLDGLLPAVISKIVNGGEIVVTYGFDYKKFALLEHKYLQSAMYFFFERILLPCADFIIVPNKEMYRLLSRKHPHVKIIHLPNGVDVEIFKPGKTKPTKGNEINILSVGRLEAQKNYLLLISTLSQLTPKYKIKLTLIGKGSQKEELQRLAKDKGVNLMIIPGVANELLPKYYNSTDIYIQPSLIEGSPKTLIEALSCGCAILASRVSGNTDVIRDKENGLLFNLDVNSLIQLLEKLSSDIPLRRRLGNAARGDAVNNYNILSLIQKEIEVVRT